MHISAPPYKHDPTKRQVSILLEHPRTGVTLRKRLVTPNACDEAGGEEWGRKRATLWYDELVRGDSEVPTPEKPRAKPRESTHPDTTSASMSVTLIELWDLYSDNQKARLRPQTKRVNETRWRNQIRPVLGDLPITAIRRPEITLLRNKLAHANAHFANQVLGLLRRMLEFAVDQNKLAECPAIRPEKGKKKIAKVAPDEDELNVLLAAAQDMTDAGRYQGTDLVLMLMLGIDAGLRPGEVAGLRWCDVELKKTRIVVRNSRSSAGDSDLPPKAGDAGVVHLSDRLAERLSQEQRRVNGRGSAYVCLGPDGGPLFTVTVSKRVADIHEHAGLEVKRAHWMRHVAASRLINEGCPLEATSAHLRHSNTQITQEYIHRIQGHDPGPMAAQAMNSRNNAGPPRAVSSSERATPLRGKKTANDGTRPKFRLVSSLPGKS